MKIDNERIKRYQRCIRKTEEWAENNLERIFAEPDVQGHYKSLYFWLAIGNMQRAGQHKKFICDKFLRSDGDFRTEDNFKGFGSFPYSPPNQYIYSNGWIISGLQKLGCYDVAQKGVEFILRFQDEKLGGFYCTFDTTKKEVTRKLMDSSSTASACLALLTCGRIKEAKRGGDFMLRLIESQPEPDKNYFSCMQPDGKIYTDIFGKENQWETDGRKQKCLSAESDAMQELTWLIGKPTKFLTKLYMATGEDKYLEGAKWGFDFFCKLEKGAWTNYASCKTMWVGGDLYRITGEQRYAEAAFRITDHYCATQSESGTWVHTLWYADESQQPLPVTMDITFEYGGEMSDLVFEVSSS